MGYIDLHVHSNKSDGTLSPVELIPLAKAADLSAFALTDHDTADGVAEAQAAGAAAGIRVIPGIEISALYCEKDIHIVGLNIDPESKELEGAMKYYRDARESRNERMCLLFQKAGIPLTMDEMYGAFPGAVITRAHFARYLLDHEYVKSIPEAFEGYVGEGCPCYLPKDYMPLEEAIPLIQRAGGHSVIAHPFQYRFPGDKLEEMMRKGKAVGLEGIEALYTTHTDAQVRYVKKLAKKHGLWISGGSDFHGENKPRIAMGTGYGNLRIPESILEHIL